EKYRLRKEIAESPRLLAFLPGHAGQSGACGIGSSFSNSRSKKVGASRRAGSLDVAQARGDCPSQRYRPGAGSRDEWRACQTELNPERLVFIDETGAATDMARRYGRCP